MKKWIEAYFSFTKRERIGIFVLVVLICIMSISPFFFPYLHRNHNNASNDDITKELALITFKIKDSTSFTSYDQNDTKNIYNNYNVDRTTAELFFFDPNTATVNDWVRLGVREKTAQTIQKYIAKGGKFYKPDDIAKIWGLQSSDVERLKPYVKITSQPTVNDHRQYTTFSIPKKEIKMLDINAADTTALIALPGIGSKLAQRIVSFRDKLGGFHSVDQMAEVYGLQDSVFQKIKSRMIITTGSYKKININTVTVNELKTHPYFKYPLANAIVQYRNQHGLYNTVEDIKNIVLIDATAFNKMAPYITVK